MIVGFGGILFVFEINLVLNAAGPEALKHYLVSVMSFLMALNAPQLVIGTMSDHVEALQGLRLSMSMSTVTENLTKTELILTSAKDEVRIGNCKDQILAKASPTQIPQ
jgi:hypothetical protein